MVYWWVPYLIYAIIGVAIMASLPSGKSADPEALTLSEFGFPQIRQNQSKRVLMGNKWITDPLVADYGDYSTTPIYS